MSGITRCAAALALASVAASLAPAAFAQEIQLPTGYEVPAEEAEIDPSITRRPYSVRTSLGANIINIASLNIVGGEAHLAFGGLSTSRRIGIYGVGSYMEGMSLGGLHARQVRVGAQVLGVVGGRYYVGASLMHHYAAIELAGDRPRTHYGYGFGAVATIAADLTTDGTVRPYLELRPELSTTNVFSGETLLLVPGATLAFGVHFVEL